MRITLSSYVKSSESSFGADIMEFGSTGSVEMMVPLCVSSISNDVFISY